jgi:hypothetical protein
MRLPSERKGERMAEQKCPLCKLRFKECLWCPLAGNGDCPITTQSRPTPEQREIYKLDEPGAQQ